YKAQDFPVSLSNSLSVISLPIYPDLTDESVERIMRTVKAIGCAHRPRQLGTSHDKSRSVSRA
ncbi:MAG: hypothetical protein EHM28_09835, partial [Spirochaetaceae bacterium]